jgi:hypothetical protein
MIPTLVTIDPPTPAPDPAPDPDTPAPLTYADAADDADDDDDDDDADDDDDDDDDVDDSTIWSGSWLSCPDFNDDVFSICSIYTYLEVSEPPSEAFLGWDICPGTIASDDDSTADDTDSLSEEANTILLYLPTTTPVLLLNTQTHTLPSPLDLEAALPDEAPDPSFILHSVDVSLLHPPAADATPSSSNGIITSTESPNSNKLPLSDTPPDTTLDARPDAKPPHSPLHMLPFTEVVTPPTLLLTNKPTPVDPTPDHTPTARPTAKPPHSPTAAPGLILTLPWND